MSLLLLPSWRFHPRGAAQRRLSAGEEKAEATREGGGREAGPAVEPEVRLLGLIVSPRRNHNFAGDIKTRTNFENLFFLSSKAL